MMKRKKRRLPFIDQIRRSLAESGKTRAQISQQTGIDESTLSRFWHGERFLSAAALDKLAEHLGLNVTREESE
ncbi:MAG: helix-turn-helix domain-containing protein, partial [Planctomycetaceae bacterium]